MDPLLILCGGASRRMGSPKPLLQYRQQSLIQRLVAHSHPQRPLWLAAGNERYPGTAHARYLPDALPDRQGPLAAILPALEQAAGQQDNGLFVLACDTLLLPEQVIGLLSQAGHLPLWRQGITALGDGPGGAVHPLMAYWPSAMAGNLRAHVTGGGRKVTAWLTAQPHQIISMPRWWQQVSNFNTPTEFARACRVMDTHT